MLKPTTAKTRTEKEGLSERLLLFNEKQQLTLPGADEAFVELVGNKGVSKKKVITWLETEAFMVQQYDLLCIQKPIVISLYNICNETYVNDFIEIFYNLLCSEHFTTVDFLTPRLILKGIESATGALREEDILVNPEIILDYIPALVKENEFDDMELFDFEAPDDKKENSEDFDICLLIAGTGIRKWNFKRSIAKEDILLKQIDSICQEGYWSEFIQLIKKAFVESDITSVPKIISVFKNSILKLGDELSKQYPERIFDFIDLK